MTDQPQLSKTRSQVAYETFCKALNRKGALPWDELTTDEQMAWELAALDAIIHDDLLRRKRQAAKQQRG